MTQEIDPDVRRLPVYLLLDCSASMTGPPIEAVKEGVKMLIRDLAMEPYAKGMVWISLITFSTTAEQIIPLTEITRISEVNIEASGTTSLGAALKLLCDCIDRDVRSRTEEQRGDYKPVAFLLTDGHPTDDIGPGTQEVKKRRFASFVACAAGQHANANLLKTISETVMMLQDATPGCLREFIKWVTDSIMIKSRSVGVSGAIEEPVIPENAEWVDSEIDAPDLQAGQSMCS